MNATVLSPNIKSTGAYYTSIDVARFLVSWAVRSEADTVMDPSCGGGVFLQAASERLRVLGGDPRRQVYGIDLDGTAVQAALNSLSTALSKDNIVCADFFDVNQDKYDAVVGNPPFVRYQSFNGASRDKALARAAEQGVHLNKLASSWASFVIHSCSMLRNGGRMAMVLPMELWHAAYAVPVTHHLCQAFSSLQVLTFRSRLFADISQDTILLLADNYASGPAAIRWKDLDGPGDLATLDFNQGKVSRSRAIDADAISEGHERLVGQFISRSALSLYRELLKHPSVRRTGSLAKVSIGYVSGNNDFFHLSPSRVAELGISPTFLKRAVRKGRALRGLRFTEQDWLESTTTGDTGYLVCIPPSTKPAGSLKNYIAQGELRSVHTAYKCRSRSPWYSVPHVHAADGFLTYMSGRHPRFVANATDAVAPNNLHVVRMHNLFARSCTELALGWRTSLARLSIELEGHAMGGGMLKLEPAEAENVAVPLAHILSDSDTEVFDDLARNQPELAVLHAADELLLKQRLGLSDSDCRLLSKAASTLTERRYAGGRSS